MVLPSKDLVQEHVWEFIADFRDHVVVRYEFLRRKG